jgi:hypothetical protein
MYISIKDKFIFIHTPKCAGNAIRNLLEEHSKLGDFYAHHIFSNKLTLYGVFDNMKHDDYRERNWKHVTCKKLKYLIEDSFWEACMKFAVVRNPWHRIYSYHEWMKRCYQDYSYRDMNFNSFITNVYESQGYSQNPYLEPWYISQFNQICDEKLGVMVNYVARMEFLKEDIGRILDSFGIDIKKIKRLNSSATGHDYKDVYTEESKRKVAELYAKDINFFGFSFEGSATKNIGYT